MYDYIRGTYVGLSKDYITVECSGVGYKIYASGSTIADMPKVDEEVCLFLEQIVREDFIGLYGFFTKEERELFNKLLTINGVGAKAALSLLSISSVQNLKYSILMQDEKSLTRAPGIGKKMAQRIILELRDKIKGEALEGSQEPQEGNMVTEVVASEALEALLSLGYTEKEASKTIAKVNLNNSIEQIIKDSLKLLMG